MNVVQLFAFGTFVIDLIVAEMNLLSNVSTIFFQICRVVYEVRGTITGKWSSVHNGVRWIFVGCEM